MKNDQSRPRVPSRVTVWLTCGCRRLMKDCPANDLVKYPCPSNLGHGYQLHWIKWENEGRTRTNPKL